jgi:hypothetical protein
MTTPLTMPWQVAVGAGVPHDRSITAAKIFRMRARLDRSA